MALQVVLAAVVAALVAWAPRWIEGSRGAEGPSAGAVADPSVASLERRVADLERPLPVQGLTGAATLADRVARLEERLLALEKAQGSAAATAVEPESGAPVAATPAPEGGPAAAESGAPSPFTRDQERRVAELLESAMRNREQRMVSGALDRALEELRITLDPEQRQKIEDLVAAHRESVRQAVEGAREQGLGREVAQERVGVLNARLTEQIAQVVPASDADAIVRRVTAPTRGPMGSGMGIGPGPGGGAGAPRSR